MKNLDSYETERYQKSKDLPFSSTYYLRYLLRLSYYQIQISWVLFCEICVGIFNLMTFKNQKKDISNQIALVTGGANGIGRETVIRLAKNKCKIAIADLNLLEAEETAKYVQDTYKVETKAFKIDISNFDAVQQLKIDIEATLGPVDILVNNAGLMPLASLREGRPQDIQKIVDVNLTSHFWMVRTFLDGMIERKRGHIVGLSSLAGKISIPMGVAYTATKYGVRGFMNALYDELCCFDHDEFVKLTTVYPSFVNTRKELGDVLDNLTELVPRLRVDYVADKIIDGILKNKRDVTLPPGVQLLAYVNLLPDKSCKYAKTKLSSLDYLKDLVTKERK